MHQVKQFNTPNDLNDWLSENENKITYVDVKMTTILVADIDQLQQQMKQMAVCTYLLIYETGGL